MGGIRQVMVRGLERVDQMFVLTMAAYNLTGPRTRRCCINRRAMNGLLC